MSYNLDKASAKILVLGDSGVGKSSLIYLLCHDSVLSSAQWTIGCSIDVRLYENHFLEFWDIGGSRSHKIARSFLYQDYHGIILVFDATNNKSRSNLSEWLMEVTQKTNEKDLETSVNINVPIIKIATKKDLLSHGNILDTSYKNSKKDYHDQHSSVVNFSENPQSSQPYRRLQTSTSSYSMSPVLSSLQSLSLTSSSSSSSPDRLYHSSSSSSQSYDPLLDDEVIQVNTRDALSFNPEKLNNFFKLVIDRRNKKF